MGNNFYTKWIDSPAGGYTTLAVASMDPVPAALDRAITYHHNPIVHCDGLITYNAATGVLTWSDKIKIIFNGSDGKAYYNQVNAGNVTLTDGQFAYVTLSETDGATISVSVATITTNAASNFLAYNILVLGYRNATTDLFHPVHLNNVKEAMITLTSAASVTVYWNVGKTQKIQLAHDVAFTFSGAADGEKLVLIIKQNDALVKSPSLPGTVRFGTDVTGYTVTTTLSKKDKLGFIFDSDDTKYDAVSIVHGY